MYACANADRGRAFLMTDSFACMPQLASKTPFEISFQPPTRLGRPARAWPDENGVNDFVVAHMSTPGAWYTRSSMIFRWNSAGGLPDFVNTLYQNILDHDPTSQAIVDQWANRAYFDGIASTVSGLFTSDEFKAKNLPIETVVDKLYRSILGREGDAEEKNVWLGRLKNGDAIQTIIYELVSSPDYRQKVQENVVPPPAFVNFAPLYAQKLIPIPTAELYTNGIPQAERLISSEHYIRTFLTAIQRIKRSSNAGQTLLILLGSLRPSAVSSFPANSCQEILLARSFWINSTAVF